MFPSEVKKSNYGKMFKSQVIGWYANENSVSDL